jgi:hypothetical protein
VLADSLELAEDVRGYVSDRLEVDGPISSVLPRS